MTKQVPECHINPRYCLKVLRMIWNKKTWPGQANYLHIGSPLTKVSGEAVESFTNHPRLDCQANNPENVDKKSECGEMIVMSFDSDLERT